MNKHKEKPIIIRVFEDNPDMGTLDVVWCPFWGEKPNLEKAKAERRLLETKNHYMIWPEKVTSKDHVK